MKLTFSNNSQDGYEKDRITHIRPIKPKHTALIKEIVKHNIKSLRFAILDLDHTIYIFDMPLWARTNGQRLPNPTK